VGVRTVKRNKGKNAQETEITMRRENKQGVVGHAGGNTMRKELKRNRRKK
jgi:hypothetical protein